MSELENNIARAIDRTQFAEAERLLDDYVAVLQRPMADLQRGNEFLEGMIRRAKLKRAHLSAHVGAMRRSAIFAPAPGEKNTWAVDA